MNAEEYLLETPEEVGLRLASHARQLRLNQNWKQSTLAERAGVSLATLRRFERTGLISLKHLLRLALALGRLDDFLSVYEPSVASSVRELKAHTEAQKRQRGIQ